MVIILKMRKSPVAKPIRYSLSSYDLLANTANHLGNIDIAALRSALEHPEDIVFLVEHILAKTSNWVSDIW